MVDISYSFSFISDNGNFFIVELVSGRPQILLDEELSNIPLCSLHCEMHNKCGSLEECNEALSVYDPKLQEGKNSDQEKLR